jgi:hypothetical protein
VTPLNLTNLAPSVPNNNIPTPLLTPLEPHVSLSKNRVNSGKKLNEKEKLIGECHINFDKLLQTVISITNIGEN